MVKDECGMAGWRVGGRESVGMRDWKIAGETDVGCREKRSGKLENRKRRM